MAMRLNERNMPAEPMGDRGRTMDDRDRGPIEDEEIRGVGETGDEEFEDSEDLEDDDEEEGSF